MKITTNTKKLSYKALNLKNLMNSTNVDLKGHIKRKPKKMKSLKKEEL